MIIDESHLTLYLKDQWSPAIGLLVIKNVISSIADIEEIAELIYLQK